MSLSRMYWKFRLSEGGNSRLPETEPSYRLPETEPGYRLPETAPSPRLPEIEPRYKLPETEPSYRLPCKEHFTSKSYCTHAPSWIGPRLWNLIIAPKFTHISSVLTSERQLKEIVKRIRDLHNNTIQCSSQNILQ